MNQSQDKKDLLLSYLVNPEAYLWAALLLFGTAAAGWILIGVGISFTLIPLFAWVGYRFLRPSQRMIALKALAAWLAILVCAVANGALREGVLVPQFGASTGLIASGVLLCMCILTVSILLVPWFGRHRAASFVGVGLFWLVLTLVFEFGFGLVQGKSWSELLLPYSFEGGNLWPLVLLVTTLAPWLAARVRHYSI